MTDKTLGGYIRTTPHPNDMDGGVAAEQIEQEADTRTREHLHHEESRLLKLEESLRVHLSRTINRAEKAEKERDEALRTVQEVVDSHDQTLRDIAPGKYAAKSRPLTPDAVTDEMVERFRSALHPQQRLAGFLVEAGLRAALTEPPTRRLEAERLDPIIDAAIRGHTDIASPTVVHAIADALAEEGVYVPEVGR